MINSTAVGAVGNRLANFEVAQDGVRRGETFALHFNHLGFDDGYFLGLDDLDLDRLFHGNFDGSDDLNGRWLAGAQSHRSDQEDTEHCQNVFTGRHKSFSSLQKKLGLIRTNFDLW